MSCASDGVRSQVRRQRGKSRKGCQRCKARHLKCDESVPECQNCLRRGIICPGYSVIIPWVADHSTSPQSSRVSRPNTTRLDREGAVKNHTLDTLDVHTQTFVNERHDHPTTNDNSGIEWTSFENFQPEYYEILFTDAPSSRISSGHSPSTTLCQSPVHIPSALIQYWFSDVCSKWSTFDSPLNYNRLVAENAWSTSEAVFLTLQTMSAAYLAPSMPAVRALAPTLFRQATASTRLAAYRLWTAESPKVDADLLFSICGLGTSLHWIASDFDHSWYEQARGILDMWSLSLGPSELWVHAYFDQALTYWNMLMCASDTAYAHKNLAERRIGSDFRHVPSEAHPHGEVNPMAYDMQRKLELPQTLRGTLPNSWCGVSSHVIDIFGQVLALCRLAFQRRTGCSNDFAIGEATRDLEEARTIEEELLGMKFDEPIALDKALGFPVETGDYLTPITHLLQTAEGYRLAALLHLYVVFEPIEMKAPSISHGSCTIRSHQIAIMALTLVSILEKIPCASGARTIHPILYLSAAIGLRTSPCPTSSLTAPTKLVPTMSQLEMDVGRARLTISARLRLFQNSLPPRPIEALIRFTSMLWSEYDNSLEFSAADWIGVLNLVGCNTLFR